MRSKRTISEARARGRVLLALLLGSTWSCGQPARTPDHAPDVTASKIEAPPHVTLEMTCTPTGPELCFNAIDDNCNSLVDCADPECTPGWTCTAAAVPSGWVVVEYSETTQPTCTTGYGEQFDAVQGPDAGPASCSCGCNITTHGSCEEGTFQVTTNELSIGCGLVGVTGVADGGACLPTSPQYAPANGAEMKVAEVPYAPGVCTGVAPPPTLPPVTYAAQGRVCKDTNGAGAGCANSGACVPAATGFSLCITPSAAPAVQACPAGFTNPFTVGNGVNDGRGCTACTCTGPTATCASAELTLFTTSNCSGTGESVPADDTCTTFPGPTGSFGSGPNYVAYEYTAQVQNEACTPSPVAPTDGGVTLKGTRSVCCQ